MHGRDGDLRRCSSLGMRDRLGRSRHAAHPSGMREAVREAAEERHGRRGGDLRRGARRCGSPGDPDKAGARSAGMLSRQPRMRVTVALADMMARIVWALMAHGAPAELRPRRNRHAARREGCGDGRPSPRRHALFAAGSPKQRASIGCRSRTVHAPAKPKPFTGKAEAPAQPPHAVRAADHARALGMGWRGWGGGDGVAGMERQARRLGPRTREPARSRVRHARTRHAGSNPLDSTLGPTVP